MGVISTPKAGGTAFRMALKRGSVGHATTLKGASFKLVVGYQLKTTRQSYRKKKSMVRKNVSIPVKCVCGRVCGLDLIVIHLASITTATNTDSKDIEINSPWQTKKG